MPRRTLAGTAVVQGVGLHSGAQVTARCIGAPSGQGIVFLRVDLPGAPAVPARISEVQSTDRRTALGSGPVLDALALSLMTTALSLVLTIVIATPLAHLLARRRFRGASIVEAPLRLEVVLETRALGLIRRSTRRAPACRSTESADRR